MSFSFLKNLDFICNNSLGSEISINNQIYTSTKRSLYLIEYICKQSLTSIKIYNSSVKSIFGISYNIPIVISNELILIPSKGIRNYENIWINYSNIKSYDNKTIIFKSGTKLQFNNSNLYYKKMLNKIELIKQYLIKIRY